MSFDKFYVIQISVSCSDPMEEYFWSDGLIAFLDMNKNSKDELKQISDDMWIKFRKDRSKSWTENRDPQTTISLFEKPNNMGILYSTFNSITDVDKIDDIKDTMEFDYNKLNISGYEFYKDEIGYAD